MINNKEIENEIWDNLSSKDLKILFENALGDKIIENNVISEDRHETLLLRLIEVVNPYV